TVAVQPLRLEEQDWIRVADSLQKHSFRVVGCCRTDDLDARCLYELRLDGVGVEFGGFHATAERSPDRHLGVVAAATPKAVAAELRTDLVKSLMREAQKLDLRNRDQPADGQAQRAADDAAFGQWGVDDPFGTEALEQSLGGAEDAAQLADVEPEHDHPFIALHLECQAVTDRLDDVALGHRSAASGQPEQLVALSPHALGRPGIDVLEHVRSTRRSH